MLASWCLMSLRTCPCIEAMMAALCSLVLTRGGDALREHLLQGSQLPAWLVHTYPYVSILDTTNLPYVLFMSSSQCSLSSAYTACRCSAVPN